MTKLFIDTSKNTEVKVILIKEQEKFEKKVVLELHSAQKVLPLINELLHETNTALSDLTNIEVVRGPGSFTGLRVGIAIANTLGKTLNIPVNNGPLGQTVEPVYE